MATFKELNNRFWDMNLEVGFSVTEIALYEFLLYKWEEKGRPNSFDYPNRRIVLELGIHESTLIQVRNGLQQKGVLRFVGGRRKAQSPIYILTGELAEQESEDLYLDNPSKPTSKTASKKPSKKTSKTASINGEIGEDTQMLNGYQPTESEDLYLDNPSKPTSKTQVEPKIPLCSSIDISNDISLSKDKSLDLSEKGSAEATVDDEIHITPPPHNDDARIVKAVVDMWHSLCPSYQRLAKISDQRKRKILIRIKEMGENGDWAEVLKVVFTKLEASKFCKGDSKTGWKATFDWLFTNSQNWVKVFEGNYDERKQPIAIRNGNQRPQVGTSGFSEVHGPAETPTEFRNQI